MQEKTPEKRKNKRKKKQKTLGELAHDAMRRSRRERADDQAKVRAARWQVGDKLYHKKFRTGMIEAIDGTTAVIRFKDGAKKLDLALCESRRLIWKKSI